MRSTMIHQKGFHYASICPGQCEAQQATTSEQVRTIHAVKLDGRLWGESGSLLCWHHLRGFQLHRQLPNLDR